MGTIFPILFVAMFLSAVQSNSFSQDIGSARKDVFESSRQLVTVTTGSWEAVTGEMRRFERKSSSEDWEETGSSVQVVVGRSGLAWGRGLHQANSAGPRKIEGDGKSPAGIFMLSAAFGFAPAKEMKSLMIPYLQVTDALECVDDVKSIHYNTLIDNAHITDPDWSSSEKMLEIGEQYRLGVVVDHNTNPRVAGKGSCIFIHIRKDDDSGTSGCTAMKKSEMERFAHWLDASAKPLLVQLPEAEFRRLQTKWELPKR